MMPKLFLHIVLILTCIAVSYCNADFVSDKQLVVQLTESVKSIAPLKDDIKLNNISGTLLGWVRLEDSKSSRTLMSARWAADAKDPSYLVLSDGWWEQTTKRGFYFVLDNQQTAFCFIDNFKFPSEKWVFVVVTWGQFNQQGYCQIYLDGQFYTENKIKIKNQRVSQQTYKFSDVLTDNPQQRLSQGSTSGILYITRTLNWKTVDAIYQATKSKFLGAESGQVKASNFRSFKQRILLDEDIYWALSKKNTDEVLAEVERNNFNVFMPCVWHGKGAYFKNRKAIYDPLVKSRIESGDDPFAYLLAQAIKKNIKIIPWFTVAMRDTNSLPEFADAGIEGAFNVHNPRFRTFISDMISEAIFDYKLETVNLDYIRSIGVCLTEKCQQDFKSRYGKDLLNEYSRAQHNYVLSEFIASWNREAVTDIVKKIRTSDKFSSPVKISVSAVPLNKELQFQGQESIDWLNSGLVDTVFSMDYQRNIQIDNMRNIASKVKRGELIPIVSTFDKIASDYVPRSPAVLNDIVEQISTNIGDNGIAIYHRKSLTKDQVRYLNVEEEQNK